MISYAVAGRRHFGKKKWKVEVLGCWEADRHEP